MSTHYCIWCLDNVCISLYYLRNTIEFCTGFQRALHIHWCYLPVRIKIYSLILVCIVTHPMTSWLHVLKFTMPHSTVYGCSGSVSFMKTPRKCGISSCLAYPRVQNSTGVYRECLYRIPTSFACLMSTGIRMRLHAESSK